jgi:hypothetical protein
MVYLICSGKDLDPRGSKHTGHKDPDPDFYYAAAFGCFSAAVGTFDKFTIILHWTVSACENSAHISLYNYRNLSHSQPRNSNIHVYIFFY